MISQRLKEERGRLGLTQPDFAELAGVKKRTLIDWEKGVSSPTAVQLSALYAAGADVQYILTGIRTNALAEQNPGYAALRPDQIALLDNLSHCAPEDQDAIKRMALLCAHASEQKEKKQKKGVK